MFGTLPIHIALVFVIFVCVSGIVFIVNHIYRWNQRKKIKGTIQSVANEKALDTKSREKISIHININSSDFTDNSTEQARVFFEGVLNAIRESKNDANSENARELSPKGHSGRKGKQKG